MSAPRLWTSTEAARATGGDTTAEWTCSGITSDSRIVRAGDLFVALVGPRFDGHDFAADALERGAAAALVARRPTGVGNDAPLLVVDDTLAALTRLARAARERSRACIIAVTGSVGKTGTKEALKLVLSAMGPTHASPASYNNHWGVPLSLAALPRNARFGIFEIAMNHAGEIAPLARLVRPDVAVITTVEAVHLENFPSLAAIADAKAEIFDGMAESGVAVLNKNNPFHRQLSTAARARGIRRIVWFGDHPHADVRLVNADIGAESSAVFADVDGTPVSYHIGAPGRHWVTLSLAVLGTVLAAGGDVARAAAGLAEQRPLSGRGERRRVALDDGAITLIDESYNANPASMSAAIAVLGTSEPGPGGRRIAVLGDMLELGSAAPTLHAGLVEALSGAGIDLVFTVGPNMAHLRAALPAAMRAGHAERSDDIVAPVVAAATAGDVLMIKGSFGIGMNGVVAALRGREGAPRPRAAGNA